MILNPKAIKHVVLDGHSLTLESFVAVARLVLPSSWLTPLWRP